MTNTGLERGTCCLSYKSEPPHFHMIILCTMHSRVGWIFWATILDQLWYIFLSLFCLVFGEEEWCCFVSFTLWRRKMKSSPIFATIVRLLPTVQWVQNRWNFCDIFICSKDTRNFLFLVFLTVHAYLKIYFYEYCTVKSTFYTEFRSVGIFERSFTIQKI